MCWPAIYASWEAATRSYSSRVIVCFLALVESATMKVDRVLRESTRALTTTFPNSVSWLLGIFSVSSRSRSAVGFHSTDAAFTWYATIVPPPRDATPLARTPDAKHHPDTDAVSGSVPLESEVK